MKYRRREARPLIPWATYPRHVYVHHMFFLNVYLKFSRQAIGKKDRQMNVPRAHTSTLYVQDKDVERTAVGPMLTIIFDNERALRKPFTAIKFLRISWKIFVVLGYFLELRVGEMCTFVPVLLLHCCCIAVATHPSNETV